MLVMFNFTTCIYDCLQQNSQCLFQMHDSGDHSQCAGDNWGDHEAIYVCVCVCVDVCVCVCVGVCLHLFFFTCYRGPTLAGEGTPEASLYIRALFQGKVVGG
jgi:hypothetical protein